MSDLAERLSLLASYYEPDCVAECKRLSESLRAHGSHWRQPYQAYCYDVANALSKEEP